MFPVPEEGVAPGKLQLSETIPPGVVLVKEVDWLGQAIAEVNDGTGIGLTVISTISREGGQTPFVMVH
ncbi:MAG: hypothetical protein HJHJAOHD_02683 [Flavobacteriales bacterium]|nr:hypothetical protein [Flavobacteriales bacterium]